MPFKEPAEAAAQSLRRTADVQTQLQPTDEMKSALNDLAALHRKGLDIVEVSRLAATVMTETVSPIGAGIIAIWLGGNVEEGVDASLTVAAVMKAFLDLSRQIETPPIPEDEEDTSDLESEFEPDETVLDGLQLVGTSLVAHLARLPEQTRLALDLTMLSREAERLSPYSNGAMWIDTLLQQKSGELIVLDVSRQKGWQASYNNLTNCFHLFTLLQGELESVKPKNANLNQKAIMAAKGESIACQDEAWWHYGQPDSAIADIGASIWGEASPASIGKIDDRQVLLLWPPLLNRRSWDAGFLSPFLAASPPSVTIKRTLSADELKGWWLKLGLPRQSFGQKFSRLFGKRHH